MDLALSHLITILPMLRTSPLLALALMALPVRGRAQAASDAMPIDVYVTAAIGMVGRPVLIEGSTGQYDKSGAVAVTITPPSGAPFTLRAAIAATGEFRVRTAPPLTPGRYQVLALAPDRKGRDTTSFEVLTESEYADEVSSEFDDELGTSEEGLRITRRRVTALPPSPPRDSALKVLDALDRELVRRQGDAAKLRQAVAAITRAASKARPEAMAAFERPLSQYGQWIDASRRRRAELEAELAASARQGEACESINAAGEGIKVVSAVMNLAGSAIGIAVTFFKDWVADKATTVLPPSVRNDAALSLAGQEMVKNGQVAAEALRARYGTQPPPPPMEGPLFRGVNRTEAALEKASGVVPGLLLDLSGLLVNNVFDKYCEKFEGPMSATLHVEFFNEAGKFFWKYDIAVEGKLTLRYAKPAPGQAVRLRGEFVGSGTNFTLWENILPTLDPKLIAGNITWKRYYIPPGAPFTELEGRYAGALGPRGFFVPVEGELVGKTITVRILSAKADFDGLEAKAVYVIAGVRTMGYPVVVSVPFPYKGGQFVVSRAAGARDTPFRLTVRTPPRSNTMVAESTFVRSKVKGDGNVASYQMSLKVCNPGC